MSVQPTGPLDPVPPPATVPVTQATINAGLVDPVVVKPIQPVVEGPEIPPPEAQKLKPDVCYLVERLVKLKQKKSHDPLYFDPKLGTYYSVGQYHALAWQCTKQSNP